MNGLIIVVMIISGLVGGILDMLRHNYKSISKKTVTKHCLSGICAAFVVPLFLNMISSDLLDDVPDKFPSLLVFMGFCIIAAIYSTNFLNKISEKMLDELNQEYKDVAEKLDNLNNIMEPFLVSNAEIPEARTRSLNIELASNKDLTSGINEGSKTIISIIGKIKAPYIDELLILENGESNPENVRGNLKYLVKEGIIRKYERDNHILYGLSYKGKEIFNQLEIM